MAHNLEYLLTRPGLLKMITIVIGIISFSIGCSAYSKSPYREFYANMTSGPEGNEMNLPGTELELYQIAATGIYLGISFAYLVLYGIFYELCESKLNKIVDTIFHLSGGLFIFAAGCVLLYSSVEIKDVGCDELYDLTFRKILKMSIPPKQGIFYKREDVSCQYFAQKIVAGIFCLVNGLFYATLGIITFVEKDY